VSALKSITIKAATAALLLAFAAAPGWARGRATERRQQRQESRQASHAGQWLRRYKDLPPDQQQKALDNDP
jgi:lipopolysaccharide biosynthesis regulator YciM